MDKYRLQWVGSKCGQHGPYTFYKSFKFTKNSKWRTLSLGEFFFVKCSENDPLCIAELQLLWEDRGTEGIMLSSLRLYFLPEHTPDGRHHSHGEDEVIAVNGKAIMSIEDLLDWVIMEEVRWIDGFPTVCPGNGPLQCPPSAPSPAIDCAGPGASESSRAEDVSSRSRTSRDQDGSALETFALNSGLKVKDMIDNKKQCGSKVGDCEQKLMVVSYPNYCRHHASLRRIGKEGGDKWRTNPLLKALGLLSLPHPQTKVLFCRDEFEHPMIEEDERLCEYTAPKLKGRPRKKKVKLKSDENDRYQPPKYYSSVKSSQNFLLAAKRPDRFEPRRSSSRGHQPVPYGDALTLLKAEFRRGQVVSEELFLTHLYKYMKDRNTPIERIPNLGFKQIDLFAFFELAVRHGGYKSITGQKQWKLIYDKLGGNPNSTSAATCTRKHYERLLFPFEQFLRVPDRVPGDWSEGREKKKKKEKKERKKSRVKHVREQLQELEARRAAARRALEEAKLHQAMHANRIVKREPEESIATATTATLTTTVTKAIPPASSAAALATTVAFPPNLKPPPLGINGTPLMAMPTMVPQASLQPMVQLSGASPQFFPQLGLKNMGQVILAIPQVITPTSVPKTEPPESPTLGQPAAPDQKPPPLPLVATVLDKVGGGVALMQRRDAVEVKQEGGSKTDRIHTFNHSLGKEEVAKVGHRPQLAENNGDRRCAARGSPNSSPVNNLSPGSIESLVSRPSVIQHTHHSHAKVKSEPARPTGLIGSQYGHASGILPNDLILRNLTKDQVAADHYKKAVAEMPGLRGAGQRFMMPYIPFLQQAPFFLRQHMDLPGQMGVHKVPSAAGGVGGHSESEGAKPFEKVLESTNVKPLMSVVQPMRSSSASSSSSSHSAKYEPIPVQEEPCDLSLPKKRRRDLDDNGEACDKRRDSVINVGNAHSSSTMIRNSPVHRLRTSDKKLHKHSSSHQHSRDLHGMRASLSPSLSSHPRLPSSSTTSLAAKVKMTPSPRGSITQGIINPTRIPTHPILPPRKDPADTPKAPAPKAPTPKSPHDLASPPRLPLDFPGLGFPVAVDSSGKPLPPLTDLNPLSRFPLLPYSYYQFLPRSPFLPPGGPFLPTGLPPGIPTTQADSMLPRGLVFRPPFPFAPSVPYSTAQLSRDNQHASLYRS